MFRTIFTEIIRAAHQDRDGNSITRTGAGADPASVTIVAELASSMGFASVTVTELAATRDLEATAHLNIGLAV